MSITDAIKKSVLEGFTASELTTPDILVTLSVAAILGIYIYFIYRLSMRSGFYSRSFNKTLALLPLITAGILLAMQGNLIISLGMVGALSIVRFRNAVKDPMDLTFLFWGISAGIIAGAGLFVLVGIISLVLTALIFLLDLIPTFRPPCLLVVTAANADAEKQVWELVKKSVRSARLRSRSLSADGVEMIAELRVQQDSPLATQLMETEGVLSVQLLRHDGEVRF